MTNANQVWAIVPAAGFGSRMNNSLPKQYLPIHDKTMLEHTLECVLASPSLRELVVCLPVSDQAFDKLFVSAHPLVNRVEGGATRAQSVVNGLQYLHDKAGPEDWVLVHDAARPCLQTSSINDVITQLGDDPVGGILAVPVRDTLKLDDADKGIKKTLDRSNVWQAQTPQVFRYALLLDSLTRALQQGIAITDEASALEWAGHTPKLIEGDSSNIKVTTSEDLALAEFLLSRKNSTIKP